MKAKKLKIGFFTDTYLPQFNGVVTSIESFRKELEKQGHEVYVFAPSPRLKTDSKKVTRFHSVNFLMYPGIRVAMPYSQRAYEMAKKIKLDVVHSHDPFSIGLFGLWISKKFKIPYIHTYHTLYPDYVHYIWKTKITENLAKKLSKDFCNTNDLIIAPSTKIKNYLKKWGVKKDVKILATGIDFKEFSKKTAKELNLFRDKYNIKKSDKVLLFLARIAKEKNIDFLIKSLKTLDSNYKLLMVGDGPYKKEIENKVKKEKIDNIIFTGYLDRNNVSLAYQVSDIFVFSSTSETQGLVIAEAMGCGLPIIALKDAAMSDMVENGINGYLTNKNYKEFSEKIMKLFKDKKLYKKMSEQSIKKSKEFSIQKKTKELINCYFEQIDKKQKEK